MKSEAGEQIIISSHVPPLFICPISLQIMRDPVTLCTGVTYDRDFIRKWLRRGNNVCPVTAQILHTRDLIPNHTLANIIQKWRHNALEKSDPVYNMVRQTIRQIEEGRSESRAEAVKRLRNLAKSESKRACLRSEGVLPLLVRVLEKFQPEGEENGGEALEEAVGAIASFPVKDVITTIDLLSSTPVIRTLDWVLANGKLSSRLNAAGLVEKVAINTDKTAAMTEIDLIDGITDGLLTLIRQNATYAAGIRVCLKALLPLCFVVSNRGAKIAEAVGVVIPVLIEASTERRVSIMEASMAVLEELSATWEGRVAIMAHPCAVPLIVTNLLLVSHVATAHAVEILLNICSSCSKVEDEEVVMMRDIVVKMGAMEKLLALLHMDYGQTTKRSANHLLRILSPLLDHDFCAQFLVRL
ncbi:hypothetical protein KI387_038766 [Taxus chinensis]|uniref:RING-type E3 ubiquitin transferase n=1 Tax=Taxus chinensis TaxID=29808 RepID=A0AA38FAE7_TAXCH|nr:hypothetical protein KI387_038766 [Taxus chinensis]